MRITRRATIQAIAGTFVITVAGWLMPPAAVAAKLLDCKIHIQKGHKIKYYDPDDTEHDFDASNDTDLPAVKTRFRIQDVDGHQRVLIDLPLRKVDSQPGFEDADLQVAFSKAELTELHIYVPCRSDHNHPVEQCGGAAFCVHANKTTNPGYNCCITAPCNPPYLVCGNSPVCYSCTGGSPTCKSCFRAARRVCAPCCERPRKCRLSWWRLW